ncbi:NAD-dependent epimerase/dehydratase family protein [Fulvimarina endophytica]|uniref:Divinyl chlorophyllide a 8-vinyl-reductase, chloroplastic n=1 Tax=Fulvimarina endophytica TaxID=2293836 RepID=A0A371X4V7_9HYPH|nr:NAD(P)H-binding protein [Fulvimarina endophytica]RFC64261.1 NAD-dependent epimerase/dehydratase family protein [Fulvimarina endophytica]
MASLPPSPARSGRPSRVLLVGATGTIGRAVAHALTEAGHEVTCFVRPRFVRLGAGVNLRPQAHDPRGLPPSARVRFGDVRDPGSIARDAIAGDRFDALVSCLASRTGTPSDADAIDHRANSHVLKAAIGAGAKKAVLLSAICVQHPRLAFQRAKLAFEAELTASGIDYSIVRPTAFFKSLSGQVDRVRRGKPYLLFGDGTLTATKPIADADLARYIVRCLDDPAFSNRILPIGGPGPAISPRDQGLFLFRLLGRQPRFRQVPPALLTTIGTALSVAGRVSPALMRKAELARIGHYYATQSMLVLDPETRRYEADLTPETGERTLFDHYRDLVSGTETHERGDHAVF